MKIVVAGAGKLGMRITNALLGGDHSVTVIDMNEQVLQRLGSQMDVMTVTANAKEISVLRDIHISSFDFMIATTASDEENIIIASFAKKMGCSHVMARVRDPEHLNQLDFIRENMDIDYIINPDRSISQEIYKFLVENSQLNNGIFSSGKTSLLQFKASKMPKLIGTKLTEFGGILPNMLIAAISRRGKIIIPHGDTKIEQNDGLYVIGERGPITHLSKKVHEKEKYNDLQKVMIVGGGKTGYYLSRMLTEFNISVKLIERSHERCYYLADHLDDTMVLHGDGTDMDLLEEEGLEDMDAFVTTTGFDEDNLLLALMAKRHGVEDVIAKVSRGTYTELISSLGVDMVLNPIDITVGNVIRYIQGSRMVISSQLIQGQAEIIEIAASPHMKLVGRPLRHLSLPDGVLIITVRRGSRTIIPNGDTVIEPDDRVIMVSLLSEITNLEGILKSGKILSSGR
ncbi:MAG: Trk system potassium transporter TrkA [Anaerovoracaceae bacterium]|nr:Trk system potassium transporter TrkA [Anaerovoracaceae bacterium]